MRVERKEIEIFIAGDGSEFSDRNECLAHEALETKREARELFVQAKAKTARSAITMRKTLEAYDLFLAQETASDAPMDSEPETAEIVTVIEDSDERVLVA